MRRLGLIGGTTWHSTLEYYKRINELVHERAGKRHAADLLLYSFDFQEVYELQEQQKFDELAQLLSERARQVEQFGVDALILCANTPHRYVPEIEAHVHIPVLHIADAAAKAIHRHHISKVALLGTLSTMTGDFYHAGLKQHGIETMIPDKRDMAYINRSIFNDFALGIFSKEHKTRYLEIIGKLIDQGAEGVVLGCTEIPLLLQQNDLPIPGIDTLEEHVKMAVDFMLDA